MHVSTELVSRKVFLALAYNFWSKLGRDPFYTAGKREHSRASTWGMEHQYSSLA